MTVTEVQQHLRDLRAARRVRHLVPDGSDRTLCLRPAPKRPAHPDSDRCVVCADIAAGRAFRQFNGR